MSHGYSRQSSFSTQKGFSKQRPRLKSLVFSILSIGFIVFILTLFLQARSDNYILSFHRAIPSTHSVHELGRNLGDLTTWPRWFHDLKDAKKAQSSQNTPGLSQGDLLVLYFEPPKKQWKRFTLSARVADYIPNEYIKLEVLDDSKGKLKNYFSDLTWEIRISPTSSISPSTTRSAEATQSQVLGNASARTNHWRTRLLGRWVDRILMNQVFYPDLIQLALIQPLSNSNKSEKDSPMTIEYQ